MIDSEWEENSIVIETILLCAIQSYYLINYIVLLKFPKWRDWFGLTLLLIYTFLIAYSPYSEKRGQAEVIEYILYILYAQYTC